jgi:2-polyprenyl-3-methyl-5-hydroxy-6-metoxy-1,4-benzoquinol methylase
MSGRDYWMSLAETAETDDVRERILTGYKDGKPFTPYVPTIPMPERVESVLDFGCGLGRNFPYLAGIARTVAGFDLPPMVARCHTATGHGIDLLSSDWNQVRQLRFDLIFASLVLQHIEPHPMRSFLRDFSHMTPAVYLITRTDTDFGEQLLEVIADLGFFEVGECVEVDHDPATHQLKVVGTRSFEEARALAAGHHVETMLRSKR